MAYEVIIGLEVHAALLTRTKLFCACPNEFTPEPNRNTCAVCLGFPGGLPWLNRAAIDQALTAALALNCTIARRSYFDRKHYFYPDMPKGYQTSQHFVPIGSDGHLELINDAGETKKVRINRVHLEEDAGKLVHEAAGSGVDYNRSGVPLIEIVTAPDLRSPEESRRYLEQLKSILEYTAVSDCKMEEGSLRCDANISLRPRGSTTLGAKTELKNMNSFRAVEKALEKEIERQAALLDQGKKIAPQTRRWEESTQETVSMRDKLEAHDYRCFTDPELAPIVLNEAEIEAARQKLPELAAERAARYVASYDLPPYDAGVLTASRSLAEYFEACVKLYPQPKIVSNWVMGDLSAHLNAAGMEPSTAPFTPKHLAELLQMLEDQVINGKMAKQILEKTFATGQSPRQLVEKEGLSQLSDQDELEKLVEEVIAAHPDSVEKYRSGRTRVLGFLVGQVMQATRGKANPQLVNELFLNKL